MKRIFINPILDNARTLLFGVEPSLLKAQKLKELLLKEAEKNKNIDLVTGALKGLNEMFQEWDKLELLKEIEYSIILLNHYELTSKFNLLSVPMNGDSEEMSSKFDEIQTQIKSIIEEKQITTP